MRPHPLVLLSLLSLGACRAMPVGGAAVGIPLVFPAQSPAVSLTVPRSWSAQISGRGTLVAQPVDGRDIHLALFPLPDAMASDQAEAAALEGFARRYAPTVGVTDLVANHAPQRVKMNPATALITADYAAKLPNGAAATFSLGFFRANDRPFGVAVYGSALADKATEGDQALILQSLMPRPS